MAETRPARNLPGSVLYLALAGLFVASQLALPLYKILPTVALVVMMALLAPGLYWLTAMLYLRSDPRIWRPESAWYRANLAPLAADERESLARAVRDEAAPLFQRELLIMAAVGAAIGAVDLDTKGIVSAVALSAVCAWIAGGLLGLRSTRPGIVRSAMARWKEKAG